MILKSEDKALTAIIDKWIGIPYYIYNSTSGRNLLYKGKGSLNDIKKFATDNNIVDLKTLEKYRIGIDCSGFVYRVLEERYGKNLVKSIKPINTLAYLKYLIYRENNVNLVSANALTKDLNATKKDIERIMVSDLIRFSGGKHVAIVESIEYDDSNYPKKILIAHSTSGIGVERSIVNVVNKNSSIVLQEFASEKLSKLIKYAINDNYIARLNLLNNI